MGVNGQDLSCTLPTYCVDLSTGLYPVAVPAFLDGGGGGGDAPLYLPYLPKYLSPSSMDHATHHPSCWVGTLLLAQVS